MPILIAPTFAAAFFICSSTGGLRPRASIAYRARVKPHHLERNKFVPLQVETRPRLTRQIPKLAKATSESGLKERLSVYQIALGVGTSGTFLFLRSIQNLVKKCQAIRSRARQTVRHRFRK